MPGVGKILDGGGEPMLPWWKREAQSWWQSTKQSLAVVALLQGPFYILFGALVFIAFVFSRPADMPKWSVATGYALLGLTMAYVGARITSWGYRTATVRHLNELTGIGLLLTVVAGVVTVWNRGQWREGLAASALFFLLTVVFFIVARWKEEGTKP